MRRTRMVAFLMGVLLLALVPRFVGEGYVLQVLNISLLNAIVVLGLNFVSGWTGQINFGQAAFYGIGAYASALASLAGAPWIVAFCIAGLLAVLFSLVLGIPSLRLRSYYLAMTTIGFGEIVRLVLVHWDSVTGGSSGLRSVPPVSLFGWRVETQTQSFYLIASVLGLAVLLASRLRASGLGRAMIATRDSPIAAESAGVNTVRVKILALSLCALYAGLAGSLFASMIGYISPDSFTNQHAVLLLTMLIVGGAGSIAGAVFGGIGLTILPELLRFLGEYYLIFYGIGVIVVISLAPGGLASVAPVALRRLRAIR